MRYIILAKTKSRSCKVSFILPWDVDLFATVQVRTITLNHNRSRNVLTSNIQERIPLGFNQPIKRCERLRNRTSVYFEVWNPLWSTKPDWFLTFCFSSRSAIRLLTSGIIILFTLFASFHSRNRKDGKIQRERWCWKDANRVAQRGLRVCW